MFLSQRLYILESTGVVLQFCFQGLHILLLSVRFFFFQIYLYLLFSGCFQDIFLLRPQGRLKLSDQIRFLVKLSRRFFFHLVSQIHVSLQVQLVFF